MFLFHKNAQVCTGDPLSRTLSLHAAFKKIWPVLIFIRAPLALLLPVRSAGMASEGQRYGAPEKADE